MCLNQRIKIITQKMELECEIEIATRKKEAQNVFETFDMMFEIEIRNK